MKTVLDEMRQKCIKTGNMFYDIEHLFKAFNRLAVLNHSKEVAKKGMALSNTLNIDMRKIKAASYLHDISCIVPNEKRIAFSEYLGIEILPEERLFPIIIHQKISKEIGKIIFEVYDEDVLNAVSCHTTLKANPSKLDMLLFIADKIKWDQEGTPPYLKAVEDSLTITLEKGVQTYLQYVMDNKEKLRVMHPWLLDAYAYFNGL